MVGGLWSSSFKGLREYVNLCMYLPYYYRLHVILNLTPFSCNMITSWLRLFAVLSPSWPTKIAMKTATHWEWSQTWSPSLKQPCQRQQHRKFISHSCNNLGHIAVFNHPWLCHNMFSVFFALRGYIHTHGFKTHGKLTDRHVLLTSGVLGQSNDWNLRDRQAKHPHVWSLQCSYYG